MASIPISALQRQYLRRSAADSRCICGQLRSSTGCQGQHLHAVQPLNQRLHRTLRAELARSSATQQPAASAERPLSPAPRMASAGQLGGHRG